MRKPRENQAKILIEKAGLSQADARRECGITKREIDEDNLSENSISQLHAIINRNSD